MVFKILNNIISIRQHLHVSISQGLCTILHDIMSTCIRNLILGDIAAFSDDGPRALTYTLAQRV